MRDLPSGTVTFLFTDIEGSTRLLEELGEQYPEALAEHRRVIREAFRRHGGTEVDTQGDAFFVAFPDARRAVAAAAEAQDALANGPIRVRMGLHTGEPIVWAEGYAGLDVHRGARICASAHGGQVVLSERTRAGLDDVPIRDLGAHRLKDLGEPQQLYQLGDGAFPPLKTLHATNLPIQASPLVGRKRELEELGPLLAGNRLVTLTGPGGSGKTRLALQLAADMLEEFPHGVFWVPLQSLRDPTLVVPTIAQTLGSKNGLAEHVGDKRLLLLLDNVEQVIESAPALSELLAQTENVKLLITSREPLRVAGERRFPVEPLSMPDAVTLFVERARAVEPAFDPGDAVVEICRRLDGLPLALELAAARVGLFPAADLLARLDRALPLLTLGARDAPERQQTLRSAIAWSHDLLDEEEQRFFRRLAVFAASFEPEAALHVSGVRVESLQSLLDKSLVRRWGSGRLGMLETIHEYADERLDASGERDAVARRHAEHYLGVAESANLGGEPDEAPQDYDLAARELDNLRKAYAWAVSRDETETALRITLALSSFWAARDSFEGAQWLETLLERSPDVPERLKVDAVREYGSLLFLGGDFEHGLVLERQALDGYRRLGDEHGMAELLGRLSVASLVRDDPAETRMLAEEALALNHRLGRRRGETQALHALAQMEWGSGSRKRAVELMERSGALAREIGFTWFEENSLYVLSEWAIEARDWRRAEDLARKALALAQSIGERRDAVYLLALLARIAAEEGDERRAGLLWGAIEAEERRGVIGQWEAERDEYASPVLAAAGEDFERGRGEGRLLTLDEAIERALARDGRPPS